LKNSSAERWGSKPKKMKQAIKEQFFPKSIVWQHWLFAK
jgi:hypothetical protein